MPFIMIVMILIITINNCLLTATVYLAFIASDGHYYPCFTVVETRDLQGLFPSQHN